MITLYHAGNSVCSVKARFALEETGLDWESVELNLGAGEHLSPNYLGLNRAGVVPTLVHDGRVLVESSVIIDYVCSIGPGGALVPADPFKAAQARLWCLRGLAMHAAVNTVSFASHGRLGMLKRTPEEREAVYARMPDHEAAAKRRDLVDNGVNSGRVAGSLATLDQMCGDIETALAAGPWLSGEAFSLADIAVSAYVFRTDCVGLEALWIAKRPRMVDWWDRVQQRPAWKTTVGPWIDPQMLTAMKTEGHRVFGDIIDRPA